MILLLTDEEIEFCWLLARAAGGQFNPKIPFSTTFRDTGFCCAADAAAVQFSALIENFSE